MGKLSAKVERETLKGQLAMSSSEETSSLRHISQDPHRALPFLVRANKGTQIVNDTTGT